MTKKTVRTGFVSKQIVMNQSETKIDVNSSTGRAVKDIWLLSVAVALILLEGLSDELRLQMTGDQYLDVIAAAVEDFHTRTLIIW